MKKLLTALCALFATSVVYAELYTPHRFVEWGVETTAGVSNSYFCVPDYLQKEIVFDLQEIANDLSGKGLCFDVLGEATTFFNINLGKKFRLGFFAGVEASGYLNVADDLFNVLGKGITIGDTQNFSISGYGDVFATAGVSFYTTWRGWGIKVQPTYFVPVAYVADATATVKAENNSDGSIEVRAEAPVDIYTVIDMDTIDGGVTADQISEAAKNGGFDLSLEVERRVLRTLDVGVFTRIPIVPGRLGYKMTAYMYAYYVENGLLNYLSETEEHDSDNGIEDIVYSTASYKVHRPFRLGAEAAWRPFGKWMTFRPELALAVRNPYSSDMVVYPEYNLGAELSLFNILGLTAATGYQNRVFVQSLCLMLNARVVELDIGASLRGADFTRSFNLSGAGAFAAVKIGF